MVRSFPCRHIFPEKKRDDADQEWFLIHTDFRYFSSLNYLRAKIREKSKKFDLFTWLNIFI